MTITKEQRTRLEIAVQAMKANGITQVYALDLDALLAAYDSAQKDAERWQWLIAEGIELKDFPLSGEKITEAVDAAIAATGAQSD